MRHTAFDPATGKPTAYAVWEEGSVRSTGKVTDVSGFLQAMDNSDHVYIEDQYFGRNIKTLMGLCKETGKIMACCDFNEIPYTLVSPSTWQSVVSLYGRKPYGISAYKWKKSKAKMLMEKAEEICGSEVEDEDIAAAVIIGFAIGGTGDGTLPKGRTL